jgi:hypothetical protein
LFRDMMIHDFDMARWLLGEEPAEVAAVASCLIDPAIGKAGDFDTLMVVLQTASGRQCHINNSRHCVYGYDQRMEVFGAEGMLLNDNLRPSTLRRYGTAETEAREPLLNFFLERCRCHRLELDASSRPWRPAGPCRSSSPMVARRSGWPPDGIGTTAARSGLAIRTWHQRHAGSLGGARTLAYPQHPSRHFFPRAEASAGDRADNNRGRPEARSRQRFQADDRGLAQLPPTPSRSSPSPPNLVHREMVLAAIAASTSIHESPSHPMPRTPALTWRRGAKGYPHTKVGYSYLKETRFALARHIAAGGLERDHRLPRHPCQTTC